MTIQIALVGFGKIACDQHLPAIAADPRFELAAVVAPQGDPGLAVPWFSDHRQLIGAMGLELDAVAICTPPPVRYAIARDALAAGLSVLLEKPPCTTLGEVDELIRSASERGLSLYAAWHSQHAAAVPVVAAMLAKTEVRALEIIWREDVCKWHPGQEWIWDEGGFGVFDPGINALSIASAILPARLIVRSAHLEVPANRQSPIAARITFDQAGSAAFDWRPRHDEEWVIRLETADGYSIVLCEGGKRLLVDGIERKLDERGKYPSIYDRFCDLIGSAAVEVDREPLRIVADAFLLARRDRVAAFEWTGSA